MNVTQFSLRPQDYPRANALKTEIVLALNYMKANPQNAAPVYVFLVQPQASIPDVLLDLPALAPHQYLRANKLQIEILAAMRYAKRFPNKRELLGDFFTAVAVAADEAVPEIEIALSPNTLPNATEFAEYSQQITAAGGTSPYTYAVVGTLPSGMSMSSSGLLSGAPGENGGFTFDVEATDANDEVGVRTYMLIVEAA